MKSFGANRGSVFQINLKPIIDEISRTAYCFPNIQLLVDRVLFENISKTGGFSGAFRLWLTDGEKSIQALVRRRLYKMILRGDIREGTYILVKEFVLARAPRVHYEGEVVYFVLKDFYAIGEDDREKPQKADYWQAINEAMDSDRSKSPSPIDNFTLESFFPAPKPRQRLVDERPVSRSSGTSSKNDLDRLKVSEVSNSTGAAMPHILPSSSPGQIESQKRKRETALDEIDQNQCSPPKKSIMAQEKPKRGRGRPRKYEKLFSQDCVPNHPKVMKRLPYTIQQNRPSVGPTSAPKPKALPRQISFTKSMPIIRSEPTLPSNHPKAIEQALNIIPLARLRGYPRRNDIYDVFVVVQAVGNEVIRRSRMPAKRDLRVVDPSTEKKVLLSVFVDPDKFMPVVGTIALIRSVTTHEWDGGSINVYPKQCDSKQWFIKDPVGIEGCDVDRMRDWWARKQAAETKKLEDEEAEI